MLPMMMSAAVVGLFWQLLYARPGASINYVLGLGDLACCRMPDIALYAVAITDIWMWAPFVMLLSLAGLSAVPSNFTKPQRSTALAHGTHSPASPCHWLLLSY